MQVVDVRQLRPGMPGFDAVRERFTGGAAVVTGVTAGSPAAAAGLRTGDVIVAIGGRRIEVPDEVLSAIGTKRPGSELDLEVWRAASDGDATDDGARVPLRVRLGTLDPAVNMPMLVQALARAGLAELSDGARDGRRGVMVVRSEGAAAEGIPAGSMVVALDGLRVASLDDLWVRMMRTATSRVRLLGPPSVLLTVVLPGGEERDVELPLR